MSLTLKIISPANLPPGQSPEFTFDELGGSIGRKPNNDFVLIDPERFISSQHASIDCQGGKYFIADSSTNGVFINNSKRPVGTGNTQELSNGDKISIGEFQLEVALSTAAKPTTGWDQPEPMPGPAIADPFDFNEPLIPDAGAGSMDPMDPLALLDDTPATAVDNAPFGGSLSPKPQPTPSPLGDIDMGDFSVGGLGNDLGTSTASGTGDDDFFDNMMENPHQNIPEPLPINEPFSPPQAIPNDWDIMGDDLSGASADNTNFDRTPPSQPSQPGKPSQSMKSVPQQQSQATPLQADSLFPDTAFDSTTPVIPESDSLFDEDDIFAALADPIPATAPVNQTQNQAPASPPPVAPATASPVQPPPHARQDMHHRPAEHMAAQPQQAPAAATAHSADSQALLNAFIEGAGLDPAQVKTDNPTELLSKLGQLTRISTEGLMMALRARATIKSSFRVNKTIIAPIENNPLKFSVTSEDALNIIFSDDKTGYMSATEAFSEGFKDLQTHQMAMMAGMQAIIKAITEKFDPELLERKFEAKHTSTSFIPGNKKAKNWEMYEEFYKKMTQTLQDDFQNLYGEEFARAYENQIRKLM